MMMKYNENLLEKLMCPPSWVCMANIKILCLDKRNKLFIYGKLYIRKFLEMTH